MKLICSSCTGEAPSKRQWFNQDTGYGICPRCFQLVLEKDGRPAAIDSYGRPGVHHSLDETPTLYDLVLSTHTPHSNWVTDLYIPVTDRTRAMLRQFPTEDSNKTTFTNQVEGGLWFDVPFAYIPAWEAKQRKSVKFNPQRNVKKG